MKPHWQTLVLPPELPRSEALLAGLDLERGLRGWQGFGWLAWGGAMMALAIPGEPALKILGALILAGIAFTFQRHARSRLSLRRRALLEGLPVAGSVIRCGKRFNPFSSRRDLTITALFWLADKEQVATGILGLPARERELPKGTQLLGLWLPESERIWLPLEIGLKLDAEPLAPPERILETADSEDVHA